MDYVLTEGDKLLLQNLVRDVENLKARIARLTSNELDDPWPNGGYVGFTTTSVTGTE
jgi:hypothetical protein